jgi:hypothetical protein
MILQGFRAYLGSYFNALKDTTNSKVLHSSGTYLS